jgi:sugar phosphate isomerase/epimerase
MTPRFSIIENTTPSLTFAEDLALYRSVGADAIGIVETKLRDDDALDLLRASGLRVSSFLPTCTSILPTPLIPGPDEPAERIEELARSIRRLAPFSPDACFFTTGPIGRYGAAEAADIVVDGVRTLARVAAEAEMTLAIELLHPSLHELFGFVHTIADAVALLDTAGEPNTAIALDTWHLEEGDRLLENVRAIATRVSSIHVNDRREPTRSWCDRVLPGDGVVDVAGLLGSLDTGGFTGWYELEIISDDGSVENDFPDSLWKWEPRELVTVCRDRFFAAWQARPRD